ncbi:MAG: OmpA family protein [Methylococcales bacterium]|nr:OmpA family protein [Methylococcales bacterium]MBT7410397.1 OmpA family protein [Methylococcales bacterium]
MFKTYTQFLFLILISNSNIALSAQNDDFSIEESNSPNQQVAMNSHDDKKFLPNSETIKTPPVNNIPSDNITSSGCMTDINSCIIDLDRDGVLNNSDECPNTPLGVPVNEIGCGIDNDKDGVFDVVDNCLNTPPNTRIDMNGCAWDSDRDVVADYKDHCPKTPKGHMVNLIGCSLDDDEDGIYNVYDECPNTKPGTKVNPVGCAIFYKFVLNDVYFNTAKDNLTNKSKRILNEVSANISKQFLKIKQIIVSGHTDNRGEDVDNKNLSNRRAISVKKYLISKGIKKSKLTAKGYGEEQPVASNNTVNGRLKNRRVEIDLIYSR